MHHKNVLFISRSATLQDKMRALSKTLDVSALLAYPDAFRDAIGQGHDFDLVVLDLSSVDDSSRGDIEGYAQENAIAELVICTENNLAALHLPVQAHADFMVASASDAEFEARLTHLLWPGEETSPDDFVSIDNMTINLATYQVLVDERPVDLTLMEYSLLSFLATHPSRAYSREALLHRVWGFEYCGGTRTVDVHIRRVRSKVGPQVASHIVTVRGVGYLFKI